jgi:hypothetical protein
MQFGLQNSFWMSAEAASRNGCKKLSSKKASNTRYEQFDSDEEELQNK